MYVYESLDSSFFTDVYLEKSERVEELRERFVLQETFSEKNSTMHRLMDLIREDVYNSTKIEGNRLSKEDVFKCMHLDVVPDKRFETDYYQIQNYAKMTGMLLEMSKSVELSSSVILKVHQALTLHELPESECGVFRDDAVFLRTSDYIPPDANDVPKLIEELVERFNDRSDYAKTDFERVCEFKRNFERIHPFFDGNGRTGRVLANALFLRLGYSYVTIKPKLRDRYFESIENNTMHEFIADRMLESFEWVMNGKGSTNEMSAF